MGARAIVLFSGGQDSTTCLALARLLFGDVRALSVHYGQRHAAEVEAAKAIARLLDVPHEVITMPALAAIDDSALVDPGRAIEAAGGYADAEAPAGLPTSFVPGRNAILLALAAAVAVREGAHDVVTGVCQTDYSGYPDCRAEFVQAMGDALNLAMPSSARPIRIHTPLMFMTKAETVQLARRIPGAWEALALSVTCYEGKHPGCGSCPACTLRARGFADAGEVDPVATVAA